MPRPRTVDDRDVLAAAARAMGRHGPTELTLAIVAAEAGLSPATLVQRFSSKRGLLLAVSRQAVVTAHGLFAAARTDADDPLTALVEGYAGVVASMARDEMGHHIAYLGLDAADPELRALAAEQARVLQAESAALLTEARDAGRLLPQTDPGRLARSLHLTFNGSLIAWALDDGTGLDTAGLQGSLGATAAGGLRADLTAALTPHLAAERP